MYKKLTNGQILAVNQIDTGTQVVTEEKHFCMDRRILLTSAKNNIIPGEELAIAAQWQKFNLEEGVYVADLTCTDMVQLNVAGTTVNTNSAEPIIFSSIEPGEYTISTANQGVDNTNLVVMVNA